MRFYLWEGVGSSPLIGTAPTTLERCMSSCMGLLNYEWRGAMAFTCLLTFLCVRWFASWHGGLKAHSQRAQRFCWFSCFVMVGRLLCVRAEHPCCRLPSLPRATRTPSTPGGRLVPVDRSPPISIYVSAQRGTDL